MATNDVVAFEHIVFVPVIVHTGSALTIIVPVAEGSIQGEPVVVTV